MAETLVDTETLAIWTRKDPELVAVDPFAQMVLERATTLVVDRVGLPITWPAAPEGIPQRIKDICLFVAGRTYRNPDSVINEGGVGPIGGDSYLAAMVAAMQLTEDEAAELDDIAESDNDFGSLWVLSTTRGQSELVETVHLPDSSGSDWWIPYGETSQTDAFTPEV